MTTPPIIDVDCNLWSEDMKSLQNKESQDTWELLNEDPWKEANVVAMLSPSSTISEAKAGLEKLKDTPPLAVRTTVGVHPYHVNDEEFKGKSLQEHQQVMRDVIQDSAAHVAAVGECGLDASEGFPPIQEQIPWFEAQVQLANELKLTLFVHERLAFEETLKILDTVDADVPIIIHCFTGTRDECREYIRRGYSISVSGYILKPNSENYEAVRACLSEGIIPLDKLMIETDAPYMGFSGCRDLYVQHNADFISTLNSKKKKRFQSTMYPNVPSSLPQVLDETVQCLQQHDATLSRDVVATKTTENAIKFFGFDIKV